MLEDTLDPLCIIVVKSGAEGGKLIFKVDVLDFPLYFLFIQFSKVNNNKVCMTSYVKIKRSKFKPLILLYFDFFIFYALTWPDF